jgi:hypothetical protein
LIHFHNSELELKNVFDLKEKFEIVFATGTVFQASANTSWVKVNDPVRAGVRLNHFARLSPDQKKSPADKVKGFLGVY